MTKELINTSGKRKSAIARATLKKGNGKVRVNKLLLENINPKLMRMKIKEPLILAGDLASKVDINVNISGGGTTSQADAARIAIAKAILAFAKDDKLEQRFLEYDRHILVADVRRKETHKPNRHGKARAKVQKSYR